MAVEPKIAIAKILTIASGVGVVDKPQALGILNRKSMI